MAKLTPPRGYTLEASAERRRWLEQKTGFRVPDAAPDDPAALRGLTENHIGSLVLPVCVAGPLRVSGNYARGDFYLPLCTVEGTLSLSLTRGCYLSYLAGGIQTRHIKQELTRSPAFVFDALDDGLRFTRWLDAHSDGIRRVAEATTRYGRLLRLVPHMVHNRVIVEFVYDTGDAAGQNMVTIATDAACRFVWEHFRPSSSWRYLLESNFSGDKNPAHKTMLHGRGHSVLATVELEERLLRRVLRSTVREILQSVTDKQLGSRLAGIVGFNMHTANALAALYLALGQDVACVAENAVGITTFESRDERLLVSLTIPSLTVGTVGGATRLPQQLQFLAMLGCRGADSAKRLAEIVCAAALALEVSLAGAIVSNEFAASHIRYGRQPPAVADRSIPDEPIAF